MPRYPDRRLWRKNTNSHFVYPGIPPVRIHVGTIISVRYLEMELLERFDPTMPAIGLFTVLSVRKISDGRRWSLIDDGGRAYLYERDVLEQLPNGELVVGMPWNYPPFNPDHSTASRRRRFERKP